MTNGLSRPRKQFLDVLRVLATCAVVLIHVLTGATDVTDASGMPEYRGLLLSVMDLVTWCVPVFLLISGYLFLHPDRKVTYPVMMKKYCRRIALAILLFGVPYACSELIVTERALRIGMLPEAVKMTLQGDTWSHMWYLYLILFLYLITPLLKKVLQRIPVWCVAIVMAVIFLGSSAAPFLNKVLNINSIPVLPDGGVYFFYYLCGYLFAKSEVSVDRGKNRNENGNENRNGQTETEMAADGGTDAKQAGITGADVKQAGITGADANRAGESGSRNMWLRAATALMIGMICSRTIAGFSVQMAYNYPFTVLLAVLLFAAGKSGRRGNAAPAARGNKVPVSEERNRRHRIPWQEAGALSFAVYLVHPVYVNLLYKFAKITPFTLLEQCGVQSVAAGHGVLILLLAMFWLAVLALATATAWVLHKIPVLRKYVL